MELIFMYIRLCVSKDLEAICLLKNHALLKSILQDIQEE